jgi:hypothetical protein
MINNKIKNFCIRLQFILVGLLLTFTLLGSLNLDTQAITIKNPGATDNGSVLEGICVVKPSKATLTNIVKITDSSHYPILPEDCTGPISPASLPGIISRAYGFITSLALNLLFFYIIYSGFMWIYGGLDGGQSVAKAKKSLESAVTGFAIILLAYVIVNTFVTLFVEGGKIQDISTFFNN